MFKPAAYLGAAVSFTTLALSTPTLANPNVVTTIKPVHSLTASVMHGVGEPTYLVRGSASPHTYSLRPSDAAALQSADAIFWIGHGLESFMEDAVETLGGSATVVELMEVDGLTTFPYREWDDEGHDHHGHDHGGHDHGDHEDHKDHDHAHDEHAHEETAHDDHGHDHHGHDHSGADAHVWLSHDNAVVMTTVIANTLKEVDPANAARYSINARKTINALRAHKDELGNSLATLEDKPFMVFHDAYQYFERQYDLNNVGVIHLNPEVAPSAGHLLELRETMASNNVMCVLSEPQFSDRVVTALIEGTEAKTGLIDPIGSLVDAGPNHYIETMNRNAQSLISCLNP